MKKHNLELETGMASSDASSSLMVEEKEQDHRLPSVTIGSLVGFRNQNLPLVDFPSNTSRRLLEARSVVGLTEQDAGREVALMFEEGDFQRPIVMGLVRSLGLGTARPGPIEITKEYDTLVLTAEKEIVLRCGKASITLANDGRVNIRGTSLLSRSSGPNRIKGGSIQLN